MFEKAYLVNETIGEWMLIGNYDSCYVILCEKPKCLSSNIQFDLFYVTFIIVSD